MQKIIKEFFLLSALLIYCACSEENELKEKLEVKPIETFKCEIDTNLKVGINDSILITIDDTLKFSFGPELTVCKLINDTINVIQGFKAFLENKNILDFSILIKLNRNAGSIETYSFKGLGSHYRIDTTLYESSSTKVTLDKSRYSVNDTLVLKIDYTATPVDTNLKGYIKLYGITKMRVRDSTVNFGILSYEKNVKNNYKE